MDNLIKISLYRTIFIVVSFFYFELSAYSQNLVSGPGGEGSISLNPGFKDTKKEDAENNPKVEEVSFNLGILQFTSTDKKLELNHYSYFHSQKSKDYFIGISGSGEVKNSVANLFSSGNVVAGGEANLRFGIRLYRNKKVWDTLLAGKKTAQEIQNVLDYNTRPASDLWLVVTSGFEGLSFKHFRADSVFSKQIEKINFSGADVNLGLNYWNARIANSTILAGATIGIKRTNNFDDLTESIQEDTKIIADSATGIVRKVVAKQTVFNGLYNETTQYPLNVDLYFVPHDLENLAFLIYSRTDISKTEKPKTKIGFGLFFLKNQNAFNPSVGLTIDFDDIFNVDRSDDTKGALSKLKIGFSTRVNIVNNRLRS